MEPGRRVALHLPPRADHSGPRAPASKLSCAARDAGPENMAGWSIRGRAAREPFRGDAAGAGCERSEVGNLNARAGGKCSAFLPLPGAAPSSLPPFPFLLFSVFPASPFLISAQPPSSLPDPRPSPAAAAAVTSKPKDKTRPPAGRRAVTCGPQAAPRSASVTGGAQARARPPPASSPRV